MTSRSPPYLYAPWSAQKCQLPERLAIPVLRAAVRGSEIVITASDSDYAMTYHKPANSPRLLARSFPRKEDRRVSMTLAGFLTAAYKLANDKARELGWIE
jgi:hypothetical protein